MEKRVCERISSSISARFFYGKTVCPGVVTNLSESGMCIKTQMCFPFGSRFELIILYEKEVLEVPIKVRWVAKTGGFYDTMGVELLESPRNYLELVNGLKTAHKSNIPLSKASL